MDSNRRRLLKISAGSACLVVLPQFGCSNGAATHQTAERMPAARSAGPVDAGPLIALLEGPAINGSFIRSGHFLLVRSENQLYALSSICTHRNCDVKPSAAKALYCPCHGAEFDLHGSVTRGPATEPLKRLAVWLDANRHVRVDPSRQFAPDAHDDPQTHIPLGTTT